MPTDIDIRVMLPDPDGNLADYSDQVESASVTDSATDKISTFDLSLDHSQNNLTHLDSLDEINIEFREDGGAWQTALNGFTSEPDFSLSDSGDKVNLSGGDYGKLLQERTITQSYSNETIEFIIKDILDREVPELTYTNVQSPGITVERITFNIESIFEAIDRLLKYLDSEWQFYVDKNKDLHFEPRGFTSSGQTFEEGVNIASAEFGETDDNMVNFLFIYGKNQRTREEETFSASGSEETVSLKYKPHDIKVYNSTQDTVLSGGISGGDTLDQSDVDYLVDFQNKEVTWNQTSGDTIVVEYNKSNPLFGFARDQASIGKHGEYKKSKTIQGVASESDASRIAKRLVKRYGRPLLKGDIEIEGVVGLKAGTTADVVIPSQDINENLTIAEVDYDYSSDGFTQSIQMNERIKTLDDAIADHEDRINQLEGQASGTDEVAAILKFSGESAEVSESGSAESRDMNESFIVGRNFLGDHHRYATASDTSTEKGFDRGTLSGSAVISGDTLTLSSSSSTGKWTIQLPYHAVGAGVNSWESLTFSKTEPADTSVQVNVLASDDTVLASDISSGSDVSNISGTDHESIKLEVELSSTGSKTPELSEIQQEFKPAVLGDQSGSWTEEATI